MKKLIFFVARTSLYFVFFGFFILVVLSFFVFPQSETAQKSTFQYTDRTISGLPLNFNLTFDNPSIHYNGQRLWRGKEVALDWPILSPFNIRIIASGQHSGQYNLDGVNYRFEIINGQFMSLLSGFLNYGGELYADRLSAEQRLSQIVHTANSSELSARDIKLTILKSVFPWGDADNLAMKGEIELHNLYLPEMMAWPLSNPTRRLSFQFSADHDDRFNIKNILVLWHDSEIKGSGRIDPQTAGSARRYSFLLRVTRPEKILEELHAQGYISPSALRLAHRAVNMMRVQQEKNYNEAVFLTLSYRAGDQSMRLAEVKIPLQSIFIEEGRSQGVISEIPPGKRSSENPKIDLEALPSLITKEVKDIKSMIDNNDDGQ